MNNSTTESDLYMMLVKRSFETLKRTEIASYCLIITGTLAVIANILVITLILRSTQLRTPSHFLISQLAIADWLVGASYALTSIKRLIRLYNYIPEVNTQLHCCAEMFPLYFGQAASLTLALVISVERVIATVWPIFYRNNSKSIVTVLTTVGWGYAIADGGMMFYGISSTKIIASCYITSSVTQSFYSFQSSHKLVIVSVMMAIYGVVMLSIHRQVQEAKKKNENIAAVKKKIQAKVGKMLAVIALLYLLTQIITRAGLAILNMLPQWVRPKYGTYFRILMILNSSANFFVYVKLNSEYRQAFWKLIGKDPDTVSTSAGGAGGTHQSGSTRQVRPFANQRRTVAPEVAPWKKREEEQEPPVID